MQHNIDQHDNEIQKNLECWKKKPVLKKIYREFHEIIAQRLPAQIEGHVVELGSGIPDIQEVIPHCLRTDIFPNPWIDQRENAYQLSFEDNSVSALILFDVFHHLRFPGSALEEFKRVLSPGGKVIILEPCISYLGRIVYGPLHHEPLGLEDDIEMFAPTSWSPKEIDYYAAQGNASRIFQKKEVDVTKHGWDIKEVKPLSSLPYILSGGYSRPQLFPGSLLGILQTLDGLLEHCPGIFATRLLVVLEKP